MGGCFEAQRDVEPGCSNFGDGLLSIGLLAGGFPVWLRLLTLGADILFLGFYVRLKDIPPFVFYLLLTLVGVVVL